MYVELKSFLLLNRHILQNNWNLFYQSVRGEVNMSEKRMFEVKCTDCGKSTTVPFEPTKGKPVYCRTCFTKRKNNRPERASVSIKFDMKNAWAIRGDKWQKKTEEPRSVFKQ